MDESEGGDSDSFDTEFDRFDASSSEKSDPARGVDEGRVGKDSTYLLVVGIVSPTFVFGLPLLILGLGLGLEALALVPADDTLLDGVAGRVVGTLFYYSVIGGIYATPIVSSLCLYFDSRRIDSQKLIALASPPILLHISALLVFAFFGLLEITYGDESGAGGGGIAVAVLLIAIVLLIISTVLSWVYVVKRRKVLKLRRSEREGVSQER